MLYTMKQVIHFLVTQSETYYIAECTEFAIVTQGKTLDELVKNIHEAISLHLEVMNKYQADKSSIPSFSLNLELPQVA